MGLFRGTPAKDLTHPLFASQMLKIIGSMARTDHDLSTEKQDSKGDSFLHIMFCSKLQCISCSSRLSLYSGKYPLTCAALSQLN